MANYGTDISTFPVDLRFSPISGRRVVAEAIARRLSTPRGALFWDRNYGTDLRRYLNEDLDADPTSVVTSIAVAVEAEATKDERVAEARASVSFNVQARKLTVRVELELVDGDKFPMVLSIDQVTVELLEAA